MTFSVWIKRIDQIYYNISCGIDGDCGGKIIINTKTNGACGFKRIMSL